ncbi:MAG: hypothetical protein HQK49_00385 [Oligoflexia bacterium]|nr:hypothetical protein [Oligoflexia bacterium]
MKRIFFKMIIVSIITIFMIKGNDFSAKASEDKTETETGTGIETARSLVTEGNSCIGNSNTNSGSDSNQVSDLQKALLAEDVQKIKKDAENFLANPFSTGRNRRLSNCPMVGTKGQDILEKLTKISSVLQSTKCASKNKEVVENFGSIVKEMDGFVSKTSDLFGGKNNSSSNTQSSSTTTGNNSNNTTEAYSGQKYVFQAQKALEILSSVATNEQCAYDIRERGLVPVVADMVTNFSQLALVASAPSVTVGSPAGNPYALAIAAGGAAAGSIMKILYSVLKPKFNWDKFEDRKQFVDLVCTFYSTRMELEDLQFFRLKTKENSIQYQTAKSIEEKIDKKVDDLEKIRLIQIAKNMGGKGNFDLLTELPSIIKAVTPPTFDEKIENQKKAEVLQAYANYRQALPKNIEKIKKLVEKMDLDPNKSPLLNIKEDKEFLSDEDKIKKLLKNSKSEKEMGEALLKPLIEIQAALEDARVNAEEMENKKSYNDTVNTLKDLKKQMNPLMEVINKLNEKDNYVATDEGSFTRQSIISSFNSTQDVVFGYAGWTYFKHILREAVKAENKFIKSQKKFKNTYITRTNAIIKITNEIRKKLLEDPTNVNIPQITLEPLSNVEKELACAAARDLLLKFADAEALVNLGTDFIDTNKDIFHSNIPKFSTFLLIPYGASPQQKLLRQSKTLSDQREKMKVSSGNGNGNGNGNVRANINVDTAVKQIRWYTGNPTIGEVIDAIEKNRPKAIEIQKFMEENKCSNLLFIDGSQVK